MISDAFNHPWLRKNSTDKQLRIETKAPEFHALHCLSCHFGCFFSNPLHSDTCDPVNHTEALGDMLKNSDSAPSLLPSLLSDYWELTILIALIELTLPVVDHGNQALS